VKPGATVVVVGDGAVGLLGDRQGDAAGRQRLNVARPHICASSSDNPPFDGPMIAEAGTALPGSALTADTLNSS
jgi:hypothetical protein